MLYISPAKINLHLDIGPKRIDGYHHLSSLFLMVDFYDLIDTKIGGMGDGITICGNQVIPQEQDIMYKAVAAFLNAVGERRSIEVRICKRIPIGGGLGGGSGNGASVLVALNKEFGCPLALDELNRIAVELGSDVPFFLDGPAALVGGRGEVIDSFTPPRTWWVLLVDPGFGVSTRKAFEWLDEAGCAGSHWLPDLTVKNRFVHDEPASWGFSNSFSEILGPRFPVLKRICESMDGAVVASLSGSGSVCFGLFDTYFGAARAAQGLSGYRYWLKETLASTPYAVLQ